MKKKTIFFLLTLFLLSCNPKESSYETKKRQEEQQKVKENLANIETLDFLSKKYNASAKFDTVDYEMTYKYQELLNSNNIVIIKNYEVLDIEKLDTIYNVFIGKGYNEMFIDVTFNKGQVDKLNYESDNYNEKFLIIEISHISKVKFNIDSYGEDNGDDSPTTYVEIESSKAFYCKGKLIDIYLKEK